MTIEKPSPDTITAARRRARLNQTDAAALIYRNIRRWQDWESGRLGMDAALFEYWLILAGLAHDRQTARSIWRGLESSCDQSALDSSDS